MGGWGYSFSMLQMWQCYKSYPSAFCWIFQQRLLDFPTDFPAQKPYLCTEFQSALKLQSTQTTQTNENYATNTRNYEPPYLPSAQPKHKGRV